MGQMTGINNGVAELVSTIPDILELQGEDLLRHSLSVAYLSKLFAAGIDSNCGTEAFLAGLVHDMGTFDIEYNDIHSNDLYSQIKDKKILSHPLISAQIVSSISGLAGLADIVIAHHERFDGLGYPLKRSLGGIPREAQLVRVADSLSVKFNHNGKFDPVNALSYLDTQSGKEFNPSISAPIKNAISNKFTIQVLSDFDLLNKEITQEIERLKDPESEPKSLPIEEILFFLSQLLDAKHSYSEGHSIRVSNYAVLVALGLGLNLESVEIVRIAALLHDLGKLGVSKDILDKPASLNEEETKLIRQHPDFAVKIIKKISSFSCFLPVLAADQEHWDGKGYPKGLKEEEIPLFARVILVVDAFDAMTSDRAYRKAMPLNDAIAELEKCAGRDFDPEIVKVACSIFKNLDIPESPREKSF